MTKKLFLCLKAVVSVGLLTFIAMKIDFKALGSSLLDISAFDFSLVVLIAFFQVFLMGLRWYVIQKPLFPTISLQESIKFMWIGHFFSLVLPGGLLGGDITRGWYMRKHGKDLKKIGKTLFLEKVYLLFSLLLLCIPFLGVYFSHWLAFVAIGGLIITFGIFCKYLQVSTILKITFLSLACNLLACLNAYILLQSYTSEVTFISILVIAPVALLVGMVPISLGGWGIREGAFIYFMSWIGVAKEPALAVSLALSLIALIVSLPGLYAWLKIKNHKQEKVLPA